jgi:hypothetical protein
MSDGEAMITMFRFGAEIKRADGNTPPSRDETVCGEMIFNWYVSTAVSVGFFTSMPVAIVCIPSSSKPDATTITAFAWLSTVMRASG